MPMPIIFTKEDFEAWLEWILPGGKGEVHSFEEKKGELVVTYTVVLPKPPKMLFGEIKI